MYHKPWKKLYLSPGATARALGVTPATLRGWSNKGVLRAETTEGGHRRYPLSDVIRLAKKRGLEMDLPGEISLRVLVVDDDEAFAEFLFEALHAMSEVTDIALAASGYMAGTLLGRFKPDVVLLDLKLPGLDGFEVCQQIKHDSESRFIRVVAMSGFVSDQQRRQILGAGAEDYLEKPFTLERLRQALGIPPHDPGMDF